MRLLTWPSRHHGLREGFDKPTAGKRRDGCKSNASRTFSAQPSKTETFLGKFPPDGSIASFICCSIQYNTSVWSNFS